MNSIFRVPWDGLDVEDIRVFLAAAGDEGVTWEAKGTERPHPGSVRKHVCAFGNAIGGFYIVGATRESRSGPWRVDPVNFEGTEPTVWLGNVIRNGLRPVPRYDIREWTHDGKHVAVVNVDPVAEPPCMTTSGEVFERVSGESIPVDDPSVLRRLYERGDTRRGAAEAEALRATEPATGEAEPEPPYLHLRLGVAATGKIDDIGARLFTESFAAKLGQEYERLPDEPLFFYPTTREYVVTPTQDALAVRPTWGVERRQAWGIRAAWDGSIAVSLDVYPEADDAARLLADAVFQDAIAPAAAAASNLVASLSGYGRAHVVLRVFARRFGLGDAGGRYGGIPGPGTMLPIQVWTAEDGAIGDDVQGRMKRELLRACGIRAWEG